MHAPFVTLTAAVLALAACAHPASVDVVELDAATASRRMAAGELTTRALTQAYLDRIARIDRAGPRLRSIIELNPAALADADALDRERAAGKVRGPLHGLPILLKDNIDARGMVTSAGSLALASNRPARDAFAVARLRAAGALLLGKTNLSEWANFRSTSSTSGWSSRGGQTRNPYVLDRNPCGSSSGTGAAIAASLALIGVGTETDGSIYCPASANGLVGLKPTVGLVSRNGIIPISVSQDTAGPMGRTVSDVALLLNALAAVDDSDPAGPAARGNIPEDYRALLAPDALAHRRIGVLRQAMGSLPSLDAIAERAITTLVSLGAEVVDVKIENWGNWGERELELMHWEFKTGLDAYLRAAGARPGSLAELIDWNIAHADQVMPFFGQELFIASQAKGPLTDPAYLEIRDAVRALSGREGLLLALDANRLDAVIAPATAPAFPIDYVLGDHFIGAGASIAAAAGTPSITVPAGHVRGLPVGLAFMGRPYSEAQLLAFAFAFEQATHAREPPGYLPTIDL